MIDFTPKCDEACAERLAFPDPAVSGQYEMCSAHHQWWQTVIENPELTTYKWRMTDMPPYAVLVAAGMMPN